MFEYYEVRFKFRPTTAPLQLHYGIYVIQHCRPQDWRQLWFLEIYGGNNDDGRPPTWGQDGRLRNVNMLVIITETFKQRMTITNKCVAY